MMNEDELIAEMVNKAEALGYRKGFKQGLLRAAEICEAQSPRHTECGNRIAAAIRAKAEKEGK